ncbi:ankyrin repeat domain-containing protein [bacterium]|nr:MAG: ankyrin repeat domain-containing protein [bacterium]
MNTKIKVLCLVALAFSTNAAPMASGWTELHKAANNDDAKTIARLLEPKDGTDNVNPNIKSQDSRRETALHIAAKYGHTECVRELLNAGASVSAWSNNDTPLHCAAQFGHLKCLKALLNGGAKVNAHDPHSTNWTPLHYAALNGHLDCVMALVINGAIILPDTLKQTPVDFARQYGYHEIVNYLNATPAEQEYQAVLADF